MTGTLEQAVDRTRPVAAADLPPGLFAVDKAIRFGHCDPAGQVFFPRWYDLLNEVAEDWFKGALGLDYHAIIRGGTGLGSVRIESDFFRPGRMGDIVRFRVALERIGTASFTIRTHGHLEEEELLRARQVIATSRISEVRSVELPAGLRRGLETYQGRDGL